MFKSGSIKTRKERRAIEKEFEFRFTTDHDIRTMTEAQYVEKLKLMNCRRVKTSYKKKRYVRAKRTPTLTYGDLSMTMYFNGEMVIKGNFDLSELEFEIDLLEEGTLDSVEPALSCLSKDTGSSAPSMMLHQISSLAFSRCTRVGSKFEEVAGSYRTDMLLYTSGGIVHMDTGSNINNKFREMSSKSLQKFCVVNKNVFVRPWSRKLHNVKILSEACDRRDSKEVYNRVLKQAAGSEMTYSQDTIEFFMNSKEGDFAKHRTAAEAAYKRKKMEVTIAPKPGNLDDLVQESKRIVMRGMPSGRGNYRAISFTDVGQDEYEPERKVKKGNDPYSEDSDEDEEEGYFTPLEAVGIDEKFIRGMQEDTEKAIRKDHRELSILSETLGILETSGMEKAAKLFTKTATSRSGIKKGKGGEPLTVKDRITGITKFMRCAVPYEKHRPDWTDLEFLRSKVKMDPLHLRSMPDGQVEVVRILEQLRDYHDLRFRSRVAKAIYTVRNPDSKFQVNHWFSDKIHAEVYIRGLIMDKDKGIAIVSFFDTGRLVKTEKWHLAEVECYNIAPEALVSSVCGFVGECKENKIYLDPEDLLKYTRLVARLLSENSWGVGGFMKPFRYWCSGIVMRSDLVVQQAENLVKAIKDSNASKYSLAIMREILEHKKTEAGLSPLFRLPFSMIGYECFMVNLTPSATYGGKRHLRGCMEDLIEEINLSKTFFPDIKGVVMDFERIIMSEDEDLEERYYDHFSLMEALGQKTKGRFTMSPASIVLISKSLDGIPESLFQGTSPHITELMTTKASWDSEGVHSALAMETIAGLSEKFGTTSTTLICVMILESANPVDLYMRMFDKSQPAANREISILSNYFRILQSVTERFSKAIGRETGMDMLDNPAKVKIFSKMVESTLNCKNRAMVTVDQTRWGPNFNTSLFGWMMAYLTRKTTEAYIPMLTCLISEFKVFGCPSELYDLFVETDTLYSFYGWTGRFHMGQGIFHYTSSLYHSMVNDTQLRMISEDFSETQNDGDFQLIVEQVVTSDDLAVCVRAIPRGKAIDRELSGFDGWIYTQLMKMFYMYVLFCIKTSAYKNIISRDFVEFNSIYLGENVIGSNDLKFVTSLLLNQTSGSFWRDFREAVNSFGDCVNSGCSEGNAVTVTKLNIGLCFKKWRQELPIEKIDPQLIIWGFPKLRAPLDPDDTFGDPCLLHFKTRERVADLERDGEDLNDEMINSIIGSVASSRQSSNYKTLFVPSMRNFDDQLLIENSDTSEAGIDFIQAGQAGCLCLKERTNIHMLYNLENDRPYVEALSESTFDDVRMFAVRKYVANLDSKDTMMEHFVSSFQRVSEINKDSTIEEVSLHILRRFKTLDIEETDMDLNECYAYWADELGLGKSPGDVNKLVVAKKGGTYSYLSYFSPEGVADPKMEKLSIRKEQCLATMTGPDLFKTTSDKYIGELTIGRGVSLSQKMLVAGAVPTGGQSKVDMDLDPNDEDFTEFIAPIEIERRGDCYLRLNTEDLQEDEAEEDQSESGSDSDDSEDGLRDADAGNVMSQIANLDFGEDGPDSILNLMQVGGTQTKVVFVKATDDMLCYSDSWLPKMALLNFIFRFLKANNCLRSFPKVKAKKKRSHSEEGSVFMIHDSGLATALYNNQIRIVISDPEFSRKVNSYVQKFIGKCKPGLQSRFDWYKLCKKLKEGKITQKRLSMISRPDIMLQVVSVKPRGKEVSGLEFSLLMQKQMDQMKKDGAKA